jgi:GH15 family glucan-1,4-alpha-glucosidase
VWHALCRQLAWLEQHWQEDDEGIWEVRGGPKPFVHSRLMSWVAFDRALRLAHSHRWPAPVERWKRIRARISREIMSQGWSEQQRSFVQYYGSDAIDASSLLMIPTRFISPADPRILRTIERVQRELESDALVYRYQPQTAADDGLQSSEGAFTPCSFWLAEALARAGRVEEARLLLEKMFTYANHVGLYAEEIGVGGEALGNFPQAFTHLSLIIACTRLDQVLNHQKRSGTRSTFPLTDEQEQAHEC